jgi:molecular chaperone DnaK
MQRDAELHADEDKRKRELVDLRNQADQMCFQLEKLIKENADKLKDSDKAPLEKAIEKAREASKGDDPAAIKSAVSELEAASHAFSKTLYASAQGATASASGAATGEAPGHRPSDDDTIDAEFEVKKD